MPEGTLYDQVSPDLVLPSRGIVFDVPTDRSVEVSQALTRLAKAECTLEALVQVLVALSEQRSVPVRQTFEAIFPTAFTEIAYREGYAPYLKDVEAAAVEAYFDIAGDLS